MHNARRAKSPSAITPRAFHGNVWRLEVGCCCCFIFGSGQESQVIPDNVHEVDQEFDDLIAQVFHFSSPCSVASFPTTTSVVVHRYIRPAAKRLSRTLNSFGSRRGSGCAKGIGWRVRNARRAKSPSAITPRAFHGNVWRLEVGCCCCFIFGSGQESQVIPDNVHEVDQEFDDLIAQVFHFSSPCSAASFLTTTLVVVHRYIRRTAKHLSRAARIFPGE